MTVIFPSCRPACAGPAVSASLELNRTSEGFRCTDFTSLRHEDKQDFPNDSDREINVLSVKIVLETKFTFLKPI